MIKPNQLSKCHNAPVVVCEGDAWDVKTVRDGSTYYYGCTKCREACDVSSDTNELEQEIEKMVDEYRSAVLLASTDLTNDKAVSLVAYATIALRGKIKRLALKGDI